MRLAFDIETDGLPPNMSAVHCIVTYDLDTKQVIRYDDSGSNQTITTAVTVLAEASELWGHNIAGFDIPAIQSIYPFFEPQGKIVDTLILSRLFFSDMLDRDFKNRPVNMPQVLYGRHGLESWGYRLGVLKSEYGKQLDGDWSVYSPEMLEYCEQDVKVSVALYELFAPKIDKYAQCIDLEHKVAKIMAWQEKEGWPFDIEKAQLLENKLRKELEALADEMRSTFQYVNGGEFCPKRNNSTKGWWAGAAFCRLRDFNPTSRQHIAWAFQNYRGWSPHEFTDTGNPKIDESVLMEIDTDESRKFARLLELQKHLGMLSEGTNAWLKQVQPDGRIHHACFMNTNTGRMVHVRPNLSQTPSGHEYRELFGPGKDRVQVGADASGLELRCLAAKLQPFDGGKFAKEVVEGDIHTHLASIYGVDRQTSKRVTYCMIYGGGDTKLGLSANAPPEKAAKKGKEIRNKVLANLTGFKEMMDSLNQEARSGVLTAIDGRPIRLQGKSHVACNYSLQSAGASICKHWLVRANELLQEAGIDYFPLGFIHDEMQLSVRKDQAEMAAFLITAAMKDVEKHLNFQCQLDSEAKVGQTWADCH